MRGGLMTATLSGAGTQFASANPPLSATSSGPRSQTVLRQADLGPFAQQMSALILRNVSTGGFLVTVQPFERRPPAMSKAEPYRHAGNRSRPFSILMRRSAWKSV